MWHICELSFYRTSIHDVDQVPMDLHIHRRMWYFGQEELLFLDSSCARYLNSTAGCELRDSFWGFYPCCCCSNSIRSSAASIFLLNSSGSMFKLSGPMSVRNAMADSRLTRE